MSDILVTSPFQPFTMPTQFKAVFNGYIYCGTVDAVDPSVSQVQVYLINEAGDKVPVAQPLRTNAGGFLVYNGQPAKFVTDANHSLLVQDSMQVNVWYAPDISKTDPDAIIDALLLDLSEEDGADLVGGKGKAVPMTATSIASAKVFDGDRIDVNGLFYDATANLKNALITGYPTATVGVNAYKADLGKFIGAPVLFSTIVIPEYTTSGGIGPQSCVFDPVARKYYVVMTNSTEPQQSKVLVYSANPDDTVGTKDFETGLFGASHGDFMAWERKADGVYMWFASSDTGTYTGTFKIRRRKLSTPETEDVFGTIGNVYSYIGNYGPAGVFLVRTDGSKSVEYLSFSDLESGATNGTFLDYTSIVSSLLPADSGQQLSNPTGNYWLGVSGSVMNQNAVDNPNSVAKRRALVTSISTDNGDEAVLRVLVPGPTTGYIEPESIFLIDDDVAVSGINPYESKVYIYKLTGPTGGVREGIFQRERKPSSVNSSTPIYESEIPVGVPALYIGNEAADGSRVTDVEMMQVQGAETSPVRRSFRIRSFFQDGLANTVDYLQIGKLDSNFNAGVMLSVGGVEKAGWSEEDGWMGGGVRTKAGTLGFDVGFTAAGARKVGFHSYDNTKCAFMSNLGAAGALSYGVWNTQTIVFGGYNKTGDVITPYFSMNNTTIAPANDNLKDFGSASLRGRTAYFGTGTINTSDAREKTAPLPIDDAVLDAWGDVQLITFQWLNAVQLKGEDVARWHFGVIAQQVRDAFAARGMDATRYGLLCYDKWEDDFSQATEIVVNPDTGEEEERNVGEPLQIQWAGDRWGIRADQCLFMEAAYQRRRCDRIEERLVAAGL